MTAIFTCKSCGGLGWVAVGVYAPCIGGIIFDVAAVDYRRCPSRCDGGVYIRAVDVGARALRQERPDHLEIQRVT